MDSSPRGVRGFLPPSFSLGSIPGREIDEPHLRRLIDILFQSRFWWKRIELNGSESVRKQLSLSLVVGSNPSAEYWMDIFHINLFFLQNNLFIP